MSDERDPLWDVTRPSWGGALGGTVEGGTAEEPAVDDFPWPGAEDPITSQVAVIDRTPPGGTVLAAGRRPSSRSRRLVLGAAALVAALAAYYLVCLYQVWATGRSDQARPVDAIVVMGAAQYDGRPSRQLAARLDQVLALFAQGVAPVVVVTGGNRPGDRFTEAETSAAYLVAGGVPAEVIVSEDQGATSWESLRAVADMLVPLGLKRVMLVSDPFHSLRIAMMAGELGLTPYVSPTRTSPVDGWSAFFHHLQEAGGVAIGRIIGFERLESLTG